MDRKGVLGTGVGTIFGVAIGLALGLWWREPAPSPTELVTSPTQEPAAQMAQRLPPAPPPPAEEEAFEAPPAPMPSGPYERALRMVADYAGEGVVRCPVGEALPDGPVAGLARARIEEGVLIGSVEEPSGRARVGLPSDPPSAPPRLVVRWWGAWPGDVGSCEILAPEQVTVMGRVTDAQGRGVQSEVGNAVDGTVRTAPDGSFVVRCWRGAECPLAARRQLGAPWGPFETLVVDGPSLEGIELRLDEVPHRDLRAYLEDQVAEDERLAKQPDPLRLALADPTLPTEARALIEQWLEEQAEARTIRRSLLATVK